MPETKTRRDLNMAFQAAGIGLKVKKGVGKNKKEFTKYPMIKRVTVYQEKRQVQFTIPTGMNPNEIENNHWLLHQVCGEEIEIEVVNSKNFTLDIYNEPLESFDYDIDEIKKAIKGKNMRVPVFAGRGRKGGVVFDLTKFPHIIIAGVTGAGKSVCIVGILTTFILIMRNEIEMYCADMKRTEFHIFRDIADQVIVEPINLLTILEYIDKELTRRGKLCDKNGVQNVWDLPEGIKPKYIILAIDEVAELHGASLNKKQKERCFAIIERISSQGRALGVYQILTMHRPDSVVINGRIKNNSVIRMAFRHSDETNSRVTLDSPEAANLKRSEVGKMYLSFDGIKQVQSPLIENHDAKKLLAPFKRGGDKKGADKKQDVQKADQAPESPPKEKPEDKRSKPLPEPPPTSGIQNRFAELTGDLFPKPKEPIEPVDYVDPTDEKPELPKWGMDKNQGEGEEE
jgi:S-DNA-T family DNA segregation ATPase FtsK/SpoIIIE